MAKGSTGVETNVIIHVKKAERNCKQDSEKDTVKVNSKPIEKL